MATKKTTKSAGSKAKKKTTATQKTVKKNSPSTEFTLFAPNAQEVYLSGDFNNWSTTEFRARRFKDGTWKKMVKLKPGHYEYLFRVDGQWWTDPENPSRIANPFGTENSVIIVN